MLFVLCLIAAACGGSDSDDEDSAGMETSDSSTTDAASDAGDEESDAGDEESDAGDEESDAGDEPATTGDDAAEGSEGPPEVIKIGVLAPLTGPSAADGEQFVNGVNLAVDEANAAGGVAGYMFEVVVADVSDGSGAAVTSGVEQLLAEDDLHAVLTGYASLSMFEVELMAEANMPYLPSGPSPQFAAIVEQNPDAYNCCWSFTADFTGYETDIRPLIEQLAADGLLELDEKTVAIISSDNPYSRTISEGMKVSFEQAGWTIVTDELVPFGVVSDWRPILARVRDASPDVVINTDFLTGNAALFTEQFQEDPTESVVFLQYAPLVPEYVELTGDTSEGILYNAIGATLDVPGNPRGQQVAQKYREAYGSEHGAYGAGLYEQTWVYFDALEAVGDPTDHDAIGIAIGQVTKEIAQGFLEFDPATHVAIQADDRIPVTFFQIQDGAGVLIAPAQFAAGEYATPSWIDE